MLVFKAELKESMINSLLGDNFVSKIEIKTTFKGKRTWLIDFKVSGQRNFSSNAMTPLGIIMFWKSLRLLGIDSIKKYLLGRISKDKGTI